MKFVLDACALIAYLEGESGHEVVGAILADPSVACYAHSINLCEVYYQVRRNSGAATARRAIETLYGDGVIERRDLSRTFWQRVGEHKSRGRIALPDCFCIALAQDLNAEVVTSDHGEFDQIASQGIVQIRFIR